MANHVWAKVRALGLGEADVVAQTASQSFDISVWQMLAALAVGGQVSIAADTVARDPRQLLAWVQARAVTVLETVPLLLQAMLERPEGAILRQVRWVLVTGEALPRPVWQAWVRRCGRQALGQRLRPDGVRR